MSEKSLEAKAGAELISFETHPERYRHWKLSVDGAIARLTMDVQENEPLAG